MAEIREYPYTQFNFVIDFGNMHPICTYFPPCP